MRMHQMEATPLCICLERSTAHGISHAAIAKAPIMRFFWAIFFVVASGAFLYYFYANLQKYLSEPTAVTLEIDGTKFIPPDIHLCNLNPLARSRLISSFNLQNNSLVRGLKEDMAQLEALLEQYAPTADKTSYFWSSMPLEKLFDAVGHLQEQTILFAEIGLESDLDWTKFEPTANINYFTCFRGARLNETEFNGTVSTLNLHLYTDSYHFRKTPLLFDSQPLSNFDFINQPSVMTPSGILLIFTPPDEYPHLESHSVLLSPGRYTTVKLRMQKTVSANTQHNPCLEKKQTVAYYNPLLGTNVTTRYSKTLSDCKYRKIVERVMKEHKHCQCLPYMVPMELEMVRQYPVCANFSNVRNASSAAFIANQLTCLDYYYNYDTEFDLDVCKGEKPCETISYSSDVSSTDWPLLDDIESVISEFMVPQLTDIVTQQKTPGLYQYLEQIKRNSSRRNEFTKYNFARVSIRAGEAKSLRIVENVSYGLENLISDLGGVAGLFLGMSFLTILEFLDLIYDCACVKNHAKFNKDQEDGDMETVQ